MFCLLLISVTAQEPRPPMISIDPADLRGSRPTPTSLPMCPNMMCTMEFIPDECADIPTRVANGVRCRGCPTWKESCRNRPMPPVIPSPITDPGFPGEVSCPLLACPLIAIPPGCEYIETFEYMGKKCQKCPVWRPGCTEGNGQVDCPLHNCPRRYIHPQCREVPTYTFMGRTCEKCPQWKKNCHPAIPVIGQPDRTVNVPEIPQIACPMLECGERIPVECQVQNTYTVNGRTCASCPTWKPNCKQNIPQEIPGGLIDPLPGTPRIACPLYDCTGINIPKACREEQPYTFQGQTCYRCPQWRKGCVEPRSDGAPGNIACPILDCETSVAPINCLEENFFEFQGKECQACPSIKKQCRPFVRRPLPAESLSNMLTDVVSSPDVACPLQPCPLIYIPPGCEEREAYSYQGQTCYKCPRRRKDCGKEAAASRAGESVPIATVNEIGQNVNDPQCPAIRCALIRIPKECEETQTFQLNGRTCYGCPKWRKGCTANTAPIQESSRIACPMFGCPRINIPKECREEQPYNFQGKICYMCPKWRDGCVPSRGAGSNQDVGNIREPCPLMKCPRILIPDECKDEEAYEVNGRTCYKCPRWRPGCVPGQNKPAQTACPLLDCPRKDIPNECKEETPYTLDGRTCYGCPKFKIGCIPTPMAPRPDVACPLMDCPSIPSECKIENPYEFQGKTCYKCPTLKIPCVPDAGGSMIECPMLDCPNVPIPQECSEIKTYQFKGRSCQKCPSWKIGCRPHVPVELVEKLTSPPPTTVADIVCPVPKCPRIRIPQECRLEQDYEFQGKTCYKCAIWRPGCIPSPSKPSKFAKKVKTNQPKITPQGLIADANMAAITCPSLRCPNIDIPIDCQQHTIYEHNGKTCPGCPTWSPRCDGRESARNRNMNG